MKQLQLSIFNISELSTESKRKALDWLESRYQKEYKEFIKHQIKEMFNYYAYTIDDNIEIYLDNGSFSVSGTVRVFDLKKRKVKGQVKELAMQLYEKCANAQYKFNVCGLRNYFYVFEDKADKWVRDHVVLLAYDLNIAIKEEIEELFKKACSNLFNDEWYEKKAVDYYFTASGDYVPDELMV